MKRERKDISFTDLNLSIDMDMEMADKTEKPEKPEKSEKKPAGSDTLDYYNDEMSRKEVERLISGYNTEDDPPNYIDAVEELKELKIDDLKEEIKKSGAKRTRKAVSDDETDDDKDVDYTYMVNLLNETQKEDSIRRDKEPYEKSSAKRTQYLRAYKTIRLVLVAVVVIFLGVFTILVNSLQQANKEIEKETARADAANNAYNDLKINVDGVDIESYAETLRNYEDTIRSLENQLSAFTGDTVSQPQPDNSGGDGQQTQNTDSDFPKTYIVQNGDNYWKVSVKFYGDGNYYTEIMKANNAASEKDIHPGKEIIIPKI